MPPPTDVLSKYLMENTVYLSNMFPDYEPPEELAQALSQAAIVAADIDPQSGTVEVAFHAPIYISDSLLEKAKKDIEGCYGLRKLVFAATYPADQLHSMAHEDLMELFVNENSMCRGSLAGATWQWEENTLHIGLKANGKKELEECIPAVCRALSQRFDTQVQIQIQAGQPLEGKALFEAIEKMRSDAIERIPVTAAVEKKTEAPQQSDAIYGKPFKGEAVPMDTLSLDMGTIIVEGKVFSGKDDHKDLSKRNAKVINFDITDNRGSVRVSRFLENKEADPILAQVKTGSVIKVQGRLQVDNYTNETVLKPFAIMPGSMPKRKDTAQGEKRVELHMHTRMSMMDALTNTDAAIKLAASWGHKAIAITDHGCVQSFTDALHTVEAWGGGPKVAGTDEVIKILYGCEGYYINDVDDRLAVHGSADMSFDEEYVAFDLETTGLYARRDKIIEIGAVRMKNGVEIDRFQTFVDPDCRLEKRTTELTGITDDMLRGAPKIQEALPKFLECVGGSVLVAHNADFDTTFIYHACQAQGIPYTLTSVDTLTISQNILTHLNKHTLDVVAKDFDMADFNHHRAGDDALVCGRIMGKLMEKLQAMGVTRVQAINEAMLPLRPAARNHVMRCQHIVLFAKNQIGLRNLYQLISEANLNHFKKFPRIFKSELTKLREGIIVGSACENNELFQAVIDGRPPQELERIAEFYDYLEVQPLSNNRFMLTPKKEGEEPIADSEETLRQYNRDIVALGEKMGKMVVATGDVHFLNPEDE